MSSAFLADVFVTLTRRVGESKKGKQGCMFMSYKDAERLIRGARLEQFKQQEKRRNEE